MAPYTSKRSRQGSSPAPSHSPLPRILIGILAAFATGLAATLAFRRRRQLLIAKYEKQSRTPLLLHDRESERDDESAPQLSAEITIRGACDAGKLVIDLDAEVDTSLHPGIDGEEDGQLLWKLCAGEEGQKQEGEAVAEKEVIWGRASEKLETKRMDGLEVAGDNEEGDELSRMDSKVKSDLNVDGALLEVLQSTLFGTPEGRGEHKGRGGEDMFFAAVTAVADEDIGEDVADDRSSAGQSTSPVLLNGQAHDFLDEVSDPRDELDLSTTSGNNALSDAVSDCSMQEVSSAPVKPLVLADEAMEVPLITEKPAFVGSGNQFGEQKVFVKEEDCNSGTEQGRKEIEVSEAEEKIYGIADKEGPDLVVGFTESSFGHEDLHKEEPFQNKIGAKGLLASLIDEGNFKILSDTSAEVEGIVTVKLNMEGMESSRIKVNILSNTGAPGVCNKESTSSTSQAQEESIEGDDDKLHKVKQNRAAVDIPNVDGKAIANNPCSDLCLIAGFSLCNQPNLQPAQEGEFHDGVNSHCKADLQPKELLLLDGSNSKGEVELSSELLGDLESPSEIAVKACQENGCHTYNSGDVGGAPGFGSVDHVDSNKSMGETAFNLAASLNLESKEGFSCAKSAPVLEPDPQEEAAVKPNGDHTLENIEKAFIAGVTYRVPGGDTSFGISGDVPVLNSNCIEVASKEMPSLRPSSTDNGPHKVENSKISSKEEILAELPNSRSITMNWSQHEEEPAIQACEEDGRQGAICEIISCESVGDNVSEEKVKVDTEGPLVYSEILPIANLTRELRGLEDGSLHLYKDEEPGALSDVLDIANAAIENTTTTGKEQSRCPPGSLHKIRREDDHVKHNFGSTSGRKEFEQVRFDDMNQESRGAQKKEIDEMVSARAIVSEVEDVARLTHSQHALKTKEKAIDQVSAKKNVDLQSWRISIQGLRHWTVKIGLVCLLIGIGTLFYNTLLAYY